MRNRGKPPSRSFSSSFDARSWQALGANLWVLYECTKGKPTSPSRRWSASTNAFSGTFKFKHEGCSIFKQ